MRLAIPEELRIHPDDLARLALPHDVRPWPELACRGEAYTHLLEPARWGSHYGHDRKLAGIYESLRPQDGKIVAGTEGVAPLSLDAMSRDPRIQIAELVSAPERKASPCPGSYSAAELAAVNPQRASPEGALIMLNGDPAQTPWMLAEPGSYAAVIRAEGTPAQGEKAKIEVAVLAGEDAEPVARREIPLGDFPASFIVEFDVKEDAPFAVRLRLVNDYFSPETGEDRNAYVSGIWVVPATAGQGEED